MGNKNSVEQVNYPYAPAGLLSSPQAYMYTPYHGVAFLTAYRKHRIAQFESLLDGTEGEGALAVPRERVLRLIDCPSLSLDARLERVKSASLRDSIATKELLADLTFIYLKGTSIPDEIHRIIDQLRRKFEIKKLLHPILSFQRRAGTGSTDDLSIYTHLASALAAWLSASWDLRILNALLKVNDTLCGEISRLITPLDRAMTRFALEQELSSVEHLAAQRIPHVTF